MVHKCRVQGAGVPSYYDRVPKLKQSMCGGIGHLSGANPDHMHHIAKNKLRIIFLVFVLNDTTSCCVWRTYSKLLRINFDSYYRARSLYVLPVFYFRG